MGHADQEIEEITRALAAKEVDVRVSMLQVLEQTPIADPRLLGPLEKLLDDRRPCVLSIPYVFGEVRWLAARVLSRHRALAGISEPVALERVMKPLPASELQDLYRRSRLPQSTLKGVEGDLERIERLRAAGVLPVYDER